MEHIHGVPDGNTNISDVLEVIQTTDPEFAECNGDERGPLTMFSGGGVETVGTGGVGPGNMKRVAYVKILEQPASKALRFRYECEGRSAGSIPGVNSTPENKTFPSIRIEGYKGRAVVVVSCVTKDPPYKPHPHNLVGKEACRRGVCTVEIATESMTVTFANLGIQCVKKKDIEDALRVREEIRVDPYRTGFAHRAQPTSIDLNAVRLCFQVFLEGAEKGKFTVPLAPVVSDPIYDKKAMSDLVICKLSDCCCTVAGGKEMILLCEKVAKEDIQIRFFEERDGQFVWEGFADFQPTHVHKQVAISFRTPRYRVLEVDQPVKVFIQLRRPSDGATSDPLPFEFLPLDSGRPAFWSLRKAFTRKKADYNTFDKILATEASLLSNATPKITRTIDEFNNNDLEFKKSHNKLATLRALNDLYNIKSNQESRSRDNALVRDDKSVNDCYSDNNNITETKLATDNYETNALLDSERVGRNSNVGFDSKSHVVNSSIEITSTHRPPKGGKSDWFDYTEVSKWVEKGQDEKNIENDEVENAEEGSKSLNELLSQVAELDQIYADTQTKLLNAALEGQPMDVDVYDNQTYTSLQMAMKNPIELLEVSDAPEEQKYEDVALPAHSPVISISPPPLVAKREVRHESDERLPPLPPKRIRKTPSMPVLPIAPTLPRPSSTQTLDESSATVQAPQKTLPSLPGTLPKQSKPGIFSKFFAKKAKKDKPEGPNIEVHETGSQPNINIGSSASTLCKGSFNDISPSNIPRPSMTSVTSVKSLRLDGDESPPYGIELTEAEHYALYTAMAPHATASEFDEMSFYYSPVEGGKILADKIDT
ncbi:embryonic polarity protein dorsal-like [Athalia rosae]|uniref:embryonic polarity protein dorsal-like n=1 Tax=Athalia rosae TaxID=37344 RepID=UPI002033D568|nr:embryonic polarity protein dorsal-like [Athalia rosae]XP_020711151.2 embryonic polarity protein dorsal-like [Athalia rosae]XP_020711152.2 embryonic polarity protein dorsal-like [Athalia rosae]XP_048505480.1 embryonic polarity protein dorsal-like [Athalia rosae]XP_048505481.1 embryonic polarity protein dorsal-like [Athalia rosae]XP_048505482.1 embryonic polarity protein dorsal-like [Athalia rosae]